MKNKFLLLKISVAFILLILLSGCTPKDTTPPLATWQKTYGGSNNDEAYSIQQVSDGGYIVAGETYSFGAGGSDAYVLKLDASGNVTWQKTFGGSGKDYAYSIQQVSDGGYIVAGTTASSGAGYDDAYVLKLDASGNVIWTKTFGGSDYDRASSIQQVSDGGYIVAGETYSFGAGCRDIYVLKLDATGNVIWQKTFGGSYDDLAFSIQQVSDGGYIVAGETYSFGAGSWDAYVLKLDASGNVTWTKTFGGSSSDSVYSIQQVSDGGYIIAGITESSGAGSYDVYVLKLDASGNATWTKTFGGSANDYARSIQQVPDGGYIVAGETYSFGAGSYDVYVLKLDASGNATWTKTFGGSYDDLAYSIQQVSDGGYIVAGWTNSFGAGSGDSYILKLDADGNTGPYPTISF